MGGPPVRATLLPLWRPDAPLTADEQVRWERVAYRIAFGVELVGHLEPVVTVDSHYTGFCVRSAELAGLLRAAVQRENVAAVTVRAHPPAAGDGLAPDAACDVALPCRPDFTDEETNHVVLAAVKAAHAFFCTPPVSDGFPEAPRAAGTPPSMRG